MNPNKPRQTLADSIAAYKAVHDTMKQTSIDIENAANEHIEKTRIERVSRESIGSKT